MWGAIIGDIVGSRFEFDVELRSKKSEEFELFHEDCRFTDDTVLTVATADSLLRGVGFAESYHYWGNKYASVGYGNMFKNWLTNEDKKPYYSFGNGSAMRVSPTAWVGSTLRETIDLAKQSSIATHDHAYGIEGATSVASAIYLARNYSNKRMIKELLDVLTTYDLNRTITDIRPEYTFSAKAISSVPEAIICFLESTSFEDAIRKAVSLGGDTDTQAAIAGSIAEAYYGIPESLIYDEVLTQIPYEMVQVISDFNAKYNVNTIDNEDY